MPFLGQSKGKGAVQSRNISSGLLIDDMKWNDTVCVRWFTYYNAMLLAKTLLKENKSPSSVICHLHHHHHHTSQIFVFDSNTYSLGLGDSRRDPGDDVHLTSVENHRLHLSCSIHVYKPPVISPIQIKGQFGACKSYYENFTLLCRGVVNGLVWVEFSGLLTEECEIERWMEGRRSVATHYYTTTDLIKTFNHLLDENLDESFRCYKGKIFPKNMNKGPILV